MTVILKVMGNMFSGKYDKERCATISNSVRHFAFRFCDAFRRRNKSHAMFGMDNFKSMVFAHL